MRKILAITLIVAGTFASAGVASASDVTIGSYPGWAFTAFTDNSNR